MRYNHQMKSEMKRKPGGQPKENPADKAIYLRLTAGQKAAWQAAADAKGLPLATWLKSVVDDRAKRILAKRN